MEETGLADAGDNDDVEVRCHARVSAGKAPSERCLHTCTLMSVEGARVLYVFGGRGKGGALDDLHMLDLEGNLWSTPKQSGEKPAARFGHSAVCHNSRLYFFGGHSRGQSTFNFAEAGEKTSIVEKLKGKNKGHREADTEAVDEVGVTSAELSGRNTYVEVRDEALAYVTGKGEVRSVGIREIAKLLLRSDENDVVHACGATTTSM